MGGIREAHIKDGVALTAFFHWLQVVNLSTIFGMNFLIILLTKLEQLL